MMITGSQFALIDRILQRLDDRVAEAIVVPPGDDAAVWRTPNPLIAAHTDTLIEGTHWTRETMSYTDVGWRLIAVNVSDLAAMGVHPRYVLFTAMLGPDLMLPDLDAVVDGIAASGRSHDVLVIGGGVVASPMTAFTVAALGDTVDGEPEPLLRRDGARVGDAVAVSGCLGASAAGLELASSGRAAETAIGPLLQAHRRPVARVPLGLAAVAAGVRAAIDISDGLLQDLGHVAVRSSVGIAVDLETIPLHPAAVAALGKPHATDLALGGGEDYELALFAPVERLARLSLPALPITVIGRVVAQHPGEVHVYGPDGHEYVPPASGWDHLRSQPRSARPLPR